MDQFALHRAAQEGDVGRVKQLIKGGASVDSRDDKGRTPLHWAAYKGRHAVAELLIRRKCDLNVKDRDWRTPVLLAAHWKQQTVVDLLLQHGAQVNCVPQDKWTLLHHASSNGWTDHVHSILERGEADLNAVTWHEDTPLMKAAGWGHKDVAALLIRAGADVNRSSLMKETALHKAAWGGHTRVVQELLVVKERLDLNPQDYDRDTPLHLACFWGRREAVMQLLVAGADTTIKNSQGETALTLGIRRRTLTLEEIRLFVQKGAFLQECDYLHISQNYAIRKSVLKDRGLCAQSIVNKFHCQSLPALSSISYFARKLPNVNKFKLNDRQVDEVKNLVKGEIERKGFCNVVKAHPMALSALCVLSLITCQSRTKRSPSPANEESNSTFKKPRT